MKMVRYAAGALVLALSGVPAGASRPGRTDPRLFTVDPASVRVERVGPSVLEGRRDLGVQEEGAAGTAFPALDEIVNIALKLWKIVDENRPTVDVKTDFAVALPKGVASPRELERWQKPEGTVYVLSADNLYGQEVVKIRYQVLRTWGGSFKGKGRYLAGVTVEPLLVQAAWGYKVTMETSAPDAGVLNVGTAEDPIAAMTLQLGWSITTPMSAAKGAYDYYIQGDGFFRELGGPLTHPGLARVKATVGAFVEAPVRFE